MTETDRKEETKTNPISENTLRWAKRGGLVVFLFFLLKGIGWIVLISLLAIGILDEAVVLKLKQAIPFF